MSINEETLVTITIKTLAESLAVTAGKNAGYSKDEMSQIDYKDFIEAAEFIATTKGVQSARK